MSEKKECSYTNFLKMRTSVTALKHRTVRIDAGIVDNLMKDMSKYYPGLERESFGKQVDFIVFLFEKLYKERRPDFLTAHEKNLLRKRNRPGIKRKDLLEELSINSGEDLNNA